MNYFEEAKKFGGSPVPSNTKVDFLEEAKKMGGTPVPAPKVDYFAAAKDFGGAPIPAPTTTAVQNPFAVEGAPIEAPVEKSSLYEFPRALVRGAINLQGIPAGIQQRQYALGMEAPDTALSAFDKIDAGELKSKKDINKFIGGDKSVQDLLSTESLEKGYKSPTSGLRAIGLAKDYLNASPEERKKIRAATQAELQENLQGFGEAVSRGEEIKKQAEPYASRLKDFTDVGGIGDAGTYVASKLGEAIPQFAPVIASGLLFRRPGVIGTSIGMELGPATQDRVDFITEKIKNEPNPEKRSADVAKYVRDSADVTLMAATVSGLFDAVLGPEAEIAKRLLSGELRKQTRKEILTAIPKVAATSGYKEGLTGGLQEIVMINAERKLGEQTGDAFTKENIIRVVDSALSEAIGGFGMSTTIEGARAIRAQKDTAQTATREGEAIRGLDALAEQEERTKAAAEDTTSAAPPTARTLDNLTQQEVEAVQRRLFAELGRPAEEQELLGALNEYVTAQNANLGVESGASVAGVSDTGAEQPAGAAGISDTGAAATSDTGGLGASGVSTDQLTDRTTEQPSTLDEARAKLAAAEARIMSDPNATVADFDAAQAEYDAVESAEKESVSRIALANADSAFDQVDQYDSLQDAIDSYEQNFFDTLNEEKVTDSFLRDYAYKEFQKRIEELRQAAQPKSEEVIKEEAPASTVAEEEVKAEDLRKVTEDKYTALQAAQELQRAAIAEFDSTRQLSDDRSSPEYRKLEAANSAVQKANEEYEAAYRAEDAQYEKLSVAKKEARKEKAPAADIFEISALENQERNLFNDIIEIESEQKTLLTKAGRIPAKNSPARQKYDKLEEQRTAAVDVWSSASDALRQAKTTQDTGVNIDQVVTENVQELLDTNPDYEVAAYDAQITKLQTALRNLGVTDNKILANAAGKFDEVLMSKVGGAASSKPVFALPEGYAHGTDYLTSQKIIREGRLAPNAGKRMYTYSQFGRKAVYLTARNGWWLDSDKAADGRAAIYNASVPFKLDPKANIREVNSIAELDTIAREIGEVDSSAMMNKLNVDNLDYEQAAREVKNISFEQFVSREVKRRREQLQKYEAPGADTVKDVASWAAQTAAENPEFARSEQEILKSLQGQYKFLQNYEAQYKNADEVTQKLLAAGIDGIYIVPDFAVTTEEERRGFDKVLDRVRQEMPDASPPEVYDTAAEEYRKTNPTYFERLENSVASDQLALFRPELAIVDRARLAAARPSKPAFAAAPEGKRVDSIERFPLGPTSIKPKVIAEGQPLYRETNAGGVDDLLRNDPQFTYAPVFVTDNPDLALGQGDNVGALVEFRPNSVSGEISPKPVPGELTGKEYKADVIAPKAVQRVTFDNARVLNGLSALAKRTLSQNFDKKVLPNGKIEFTRKGVSAGPALSPDTVGEYTRQPGETLEEYQERILSGPKSKLSSEIVDLLRNNDLKGALQAVAAKFNTGAKIRTFYGDLATRLAELNLPTEVRIGDQRNLTRRSIDKMVAPQQVRLFAYIRVKQPFMFDEYFKDYSSDKALELVYAGLLELQKFNPQKTLGPVINEYNDVLRAYNLNMPGVLANGAYYAMFDAMNLNDSVGLSNGLDYHTFLHETVHAATETLLQTPENLRTAQQNEAIKELRNLYKLAKDNIKVDEYGLTNLSEFIAEVFTNKRFQDLLKGIPYTPAKTNIFKRFIQAILNLVGMDNVAGRAMVEAEKLFSADRPLALTSAGPRFMAAKKKRVRGPISTPDTYRTANENQNTLLGVIKDAASGQMQWSDARKILIPAVWEAANVNTRKSLLYVANLTQLEDITRTKFSQLTGALKIIRDMVAYRAKKLNTASDITRRWVAAQSKNYNQSQLMGRVMLEATIRGIDPDTAQAGTLNKPLQDAWNTLNPEFKQIYRDVRNFYTDSVNEMIKEMKLRASQITDSAQRDELLRKIDAQFGPDKLIKPYFPMRRFGQYWFQVGSGNFKEFYEFESPVAREIAMRKRIAQLSKGNKQQKDLVSTVRKGNGISELYGQNRGTTQVLNDVNELVQNISATDVADLKVQLEDSLNQLVYLLLPQQSMRKMFINRKAIQGASADMLRVFATSAVHSAYQQARFKFAEGFLTNLNNARDEIDGAEKAGALDRDQAAVYRDFIAEVENRVPTIMSNEDTSFVAQAASKASELTFYYMLSAPFTAMLNNIGAVQIAMPYLGGTYGYAKANAVLLKNLGRYLATVPSRTFAPLKTGQVMQVNFPSIVEGGKLDPLMQRAADRFLDDGQIDISMTNDIMDLGGRPSEMYTGTNANIKKAMSGLFHQSERLNREVFLLSTFELAYEKYSNDFQRQPGMEGLKGVYLRDAQGNRIKNTPDQAFELAIEEATRTAALTLGDYSRQMKGRVFANPVMNVLLKFKQYPIMAMYAVWRNFHLGAIAPFQKAELDQYRALLERELSNDPNKDAVIEQRMQEVEAQRKDMHKEGRRRLAGILGMSTLLGGVAATPFFSLVIGPLVKMFGNDDDDEFFDWENWFYNYMETEFGGYAAAMLTSMGMEEDTAEKAGRTIGEVTARGLPTLAGAALSERVSLDPKNLLWRDGRYSPDVRENVIETMIANAGPVVGLALNFADAAQLVKEGQYARAAEKLLPAIIAKPVSAARMSEEGARTKGGDVLLNDLTATELAMQAIGLQPDRLAQKQKAAVAMKQKEQKIKDQRSAIMNRLWLERDNPEGFSDALDRAIEFSVKHPGLAISGDKINKSFQKRARRAAEVEVYGADIDKKLRPELMDMGDFADDE